LFTYDIANNFINLTAHLSFDSVTMDNGEIQTHRSEELEALQAFYGDQYLLSNSLLPSSNHAAQQEEALSIHGPWFIRLVSPSSHKGIKIPTLEIRPSESYPFDAPMPLLHHVALNSAQQTELINELLEMHEPMMGVCILWAERCREEFSTADIIDVQQDGEMDDCNTSLCVDVSEGVNDLTVTDKNPPNIELSIQFLSYNHLLYGKAHKKEAALVSTASKMGLVGFVTYGSPGIIGILVSSSARRSSNLGIATTDADVVDFSKECGKIGKKCTLLSDHTIELNLDGLKKKCKEQSSIGGVATAKSNNKGQSTKQPQVDGLYPLLVDLLGEDKVTICSKNQQEMMMSITKKGLYSFSSCAELKKVLVDKHGMDESLFQQIIGVV
jgi:hypothetical protein